MLEIEKYVYQIHREQVVMSAKVAALSALLMEKGVFSADEFTKSIEKVMSHEKITAPLAVIDEQIRELDKMNAAPEEYLEDIFSGLFSGGTSNNKQ